MSRRAATGDACLFVCLLQLVYSLSVSKFHSPPPSRDTILCAGGGRAQNFVLIVKNKVHVMIRISSHHALQPRKKGPPRQESGASALKKAWRNELAKQT